jgi:hypothetical protein
METRSFLVEIKDPDHLTLEGLKQQIDGDKSKKSGLIKAFKGKSKAALNP